MTAPTVRVRIAVAIDSRGRWDAAGWDEHPDKEAVEYLESRARSFRRGSICPRPSCGWRPTYRSRRSASWRGRWGHDPRRDEGRQRRYPPQGLHLARAALAKAEEVTS